MLRTKQVLTAAGSATVEMTPEEDARFDAGRAPPTQAKIDARADARADARVSMVAEIAEALGLDRPEAAIRASLRIIERRNAQ